MISIKINGRLGNQMFQYAFANAAAKKIKTFFFITPESFSLFILPKYFKLGLYGAIFRNKFAKNIINKLLKRINYKRVHIDNSNYHCELSLENKKTYSGYFQSKLYFEKNQKAIHNKYKIRGKYIKLFSDNYGDIFKANNVIALHIRRTDYLQHGNVKLGGKDVSLSWHYYYNILKNIENLNRYQIIAVGDDLEYLKNNIPLNNIRLEKNNQIVDFQILLNANVLVISNSTFAWWAAYLNKQPNKQVYAPKHWLGHKNKYTYPVDIMDHLDWKWI